MLLEEAVDVPPPAVERDLVSEANHRIANSLTLVAALARRQHAALRDAQADMSPDEVRLMLAELVGRIEAVGRLHRILSSAASDEALDLGAYLQQIVSEVVTSMTTPQAVILHFACELGGLVPPERALHVGLIVMELVINSMKHAHPAHIQGHIEIVCRRDPDAIVVIVSDDGVGLPEKFSHGGSEHSGMRLINALARQIGAAVRFDSGSLGLRCEITAPVLTAIENTGIRNG